MAIRLRGGGECATAREDDDQAAISRVTLNILNIQALSQRA